MVMGRGCLNIVPAGEAVLTPTHLGVVMEYEAGAGVGPTPEGGHGVRGWCVVGPHTWGWSWSTRLVRGGNPPAQREVISGERDRVSPLQQNVS